MGTRAKSALVVGGLTLALALGWALTRQESERAPVTRSDEPAGENKPGKSESESPAAAAKAPKILRPPIHMRGRDAGTQRAATPGPQLELFADEAIDSEWASAHESRVREVVDRLRLEVDGAVKTPTIECRSRHCRIEVVASEAASFHSFVESMQDSRGFYGVADSLMLEALETPESGGSHYGVTAFLRFGD